jgi:hypothetical protein
MVREVPHPHILFRMVFDAPLVAAVPALWNPIGRLKHNESNRFFGNIAPYTGYFK